MAVRVGWSTLDGAYAYYFLVREELEDEFSMKSMALALTWLASARSRRTLRDPHDTVRQEVRQDARSASDSPSIRSPGDRGNMRTTIQVQPGQPGQARYQRSSGSARPAQPGNSNGATTTGIRLARISELGEMSKSIVMTPEVAVSKWPRRSPVTTT